jgi:penicillin-binding protein 2
MNIYEDLRLLQTKLSWGRFFCVAIILGLAARFWQLQVVRAPSYRELARANHVRQIPENAPRGLILDRYGRIIGENRPSFNLTVEDPKRDETTVSALANLLSLTDEELSALETNGNRSPRYDPTLLKEDIPLQEVALVEARQFELPGAIIQFVPRRFYPFGTLASHVLGYVGRITEEQIGKAPFEDAGSNDYVGQSGVELIYDKILFGRNGVQRVVVNSRGRRERMLAEVPPLWGETVQLSLDLDMQQTLENAFDEKAGAAVVLDPRNGQLLALGSFPSFDPNFFSGSFSQEDWRALVQSPEHRLQNRATQGRYPPGSIFKLVIAAAALEEGVIEPSTKMTCSGWVRLYGKVFRCHKASGHGRVDLHEALKQSCNSYFYQLGAKLQIDTIARYARMMGLGVETGIDLPFEVSGLVPDPEWKRRSRNQPWYAGETVSVAVGQGSVLVTAIQMAQLAAIVGSSGEVHRPRVFLDSSPAGSTHRPSPQPAIAQPVRRVRLQESTWRVLQDAMWSVVNDGGTGWRARIPGFDVCGKTGTAQVVSRSRAAQLKDSERPEHLRAHAWFVGFAPRVNPEIAMAVLVEHGSGGGQAAAPIAGEVFRTFFEKAKEQKAKRAQQASLVRN